MTTMSEKDDPCVAIGTRQRQLLRIRIALIFNRPALRVIERKAVLGEVLAGLFIII